VLSTISLPIVDTNGSFASWYMASVVKSQRFGGVILRLMSSNILSDSLVSQKLPNRIEPTSYLTLKLYWDFGARVRANYIFTWSSSVDIIDGYAMIAPIMSDGIPFHCMS